MHDDVTSQERSKERLYEEEIELKWEKGGSGLVFYTDAQYWQEDEGGMIFFCKQLKLVSFKYFIPIIQLIREYLVNERLNYVSCSFFPQDFDEQTADDWDVDMSVYYDKGMCGFFSLDSAFAEGFFKLGISSHRWR